MVALIDDAFSVAHFGCGVVEVMEDRDKTAGKRSDGPTLMTLLRNNVAVAKK